MRLDARAETTKPVGVEPDCRASTRRRQDSYHLGIGGAIVSCPREALQLTVIKMPGRSEVATPTWCDGSWYFRAVCSHVSVSRTVPVSQRVLVLALYSVHSVRVRPRRTREFGGRAHLACHRRRSATNDTSDAAVPPICRRGSDAGLLISWVDCSSRRHALVARNRRTRPI